MHQPNCLIYICTCKSKNILQVITLLAALHLSGCTKNIKTDSSSVIVPTSEEVVVSPVSSTDPSVDSGEITLTPDQYYSTEAERKAIAAAQIKLNEIKNSKCFEDFITARKMIQTGNRTSEQVAKHLKAISGNVKVNMYYRRFTSAVAYRQPPSMEINLNRNYFHPSMDICKEWASTIGHESLGHSLGDYDHDYNWSPERDYSVPYSINQAFTHCCK